MVRKIFCLETEWCQNVHDLKRPSTVLPLLEFIKNAEKVEYTFRQVATNEDFKYYINHLFKATYESFENIYLCFHGSPHEIAFVDTNSLDLLTFAEENKGIFNGKNVHFGSCSTLRMSDEEVLEFKSLTKARMVTGYTKRVEFTSSFIFEAWLLKTISRRTGLGGKRLKALAEKEMPYFCKLFGFKAY